MPAALESWHGNVPGSQRALGHPHPPPLLGIGCQQQGPAPPEAQKLGPNCIVQRCKRTWCSCTALLSQPGPKPRPQVLPSLLRQPVPRGSLFPALQACSTVKSPVPLPTAPCTARAGGRSQGRGDAAPGELARAGRHLLPWSRGAAEAISTAPHLNAIFGTERQEEEGRTALEG